MVVSFRFFLTLNPDDGSKPTPTMETHVPPEGDGKSVPNTFITFITVYMLFKDVKCLMMSIKSATLGCCGLGLIQLIAVKCIDGAKYDSLNVFKMNESLPEEVVFIQSWRNVTLRSGCVQYSSRRSLYRLNPCGIQGNSRCQNRDRYNDIFKYLHPGILIWFVANVGFVCVFEIRSYKWIQSGWQRLINLNVLSVQKDLCVLSLQRSQLQH